MKRNVQLTSFAAATELAHRHRALVEVIDGNLLVTEIDGFSHVVGDCGRQVGVAKKRPTAEIDGFNIAFQIGILLPCQHGAGKADPFHMARGGIVDRQEAHACTEGGGSPALHAFVEDGVCFTGFDMVSPVATAGIWRFHHFAAPFFDLAETHAVGFKNFLDRVYRCLESVPTAGRNAQGILPILDIFEGFDAAIFAHCENQPVPGGKDTDGAQRDLLFIKTAAEVRHG